MNERFRKTFDWKIRALTILIFTLGIPLAIILILTLLTATPIVGQLMAGLYIEILPCNWDSNGTLTCIVFGHNIGYELHALLLMMYLGGVFNFVFAYKLLITFFSIQFLLAWISVVVLLIAIKWNILRRIGNGG